MADSPEKSEAAKREEEILAFWQEHQIFEKSLQKESPKGDFIFYDGPPFATGLPHSGSLLASVSKDLIPRYKTMRGYNVRRRWGWDTHGLPIETLVEQRLGLKNKKEILAIGVEKFNETAREMVLEYVHDWKRYVERVGRFVDFDNSYKTMDPTYTESVWWAIKQIHNKGHLYEGRKVLMYCPHCETPLAKAEIAMDNTYKDVTDEAVTVKFKVKDPQKYGFPENTFMLAWTTTPWTLPGNVALAVGRNIQYGIYKKANENLIIAKNLAEQNGLVDFVREALANALIGVSYEPLYEISKVAAYEGKKWQVVAGDFVNTEEGTGIVHTAVIYGEDDYALGLKEGLPMVPLLNPNATYNDDAPQFLHGKYIKKAEADIKADLERRGLLFAKAPHKHSYPHCYRCGTALIYNAVSSWFINIQAVKHKLVAENEKINWSPEHLKYGRFKHILETAPDWTISRNRFWASPLPIWKDKDGKVTVVGSLDELKQRTKKSGNTYFAMRHGESENNVQNILSCDKDAIYALTKKGVAETDRAIKSLTCKPTKIYSSPFVRTRQTAEMVAKHFRLPAESIIYDDRLGEFNAGDLNDKHIDEFRTFRRTHDFRESFPNGESSLEVKQRFGEFLYDIENKNEHECIFIVTHGAGVEALLAIANGANVDEFRDIVIERDILNGETCELDFVPLPHNRGYELDYHLPYIDEVQLVNEKGEALTRIPEVVDCWVESGSMPFAEYNYPFENKKEFESRTPGDFVSEYIGQTRAWFYYMHAMGVELFGHASFKNVLTTGTILAADGEKLSKSKQNYTDPYVLFDRFSADAFRYYLMSSVVMQAEDLIFRDDEVKEIQSRVVNMLRNVLAFYSLFRDDLKEGKHESENALDKWILMRLAEVAEIATDNFEQYDILHAVRPMRDFISDLSTWYIQRSRDRIKGTDEVDKQSALRTLQEVLTEFSKIIAPVMPFLAEEIFQVTRSDKDPESVHLAAWPVIRHRIDQKLLKDMERVRELTSQTLMERQEKKQPLQQQLPTLQIEVADEIRITASMLTSILKEATNVENVVRGSNFSLDTNLTLELVRKGDVRRFTRALADARKERHLSPKDTVSLTIAESARATLEGAQIPGVSQMNYGPARDFTAELSSGPVQFSFVKDGA